ncbi:hypothetical protein AAG570_013360 [Ranatra chinensis]|uniref:U5 small nuclear ribonucleoprotein TSSC4 n=1 Tax=Ranatra chinensis TaxID=642074 RepID=A0ABD0YC81_9HEMI
MVKIVEPNYFLPTPSTSFNERQKNVFDELDKVSTSRTDNRYTEEELRNSEMRVARTVSGTRREMKKFRGQESIFKKPEVPPVPGQWKRKMPDFKTNPHKWTKYSLEDQDDMSDQSNRAAALSFLKEMSHRNESKPDSAEGSGQGPQRIVFNRHVNELQEAEAKQEAEEKPTFIGGKFVMPEYVVGQKTKPKKAAKKSVADTLVNVKLDHLLEEENVEEQ